MAKNTLQGISPTKKNVSCLISIWLIYIAKTSKASSTYSFSVKNGLDFFHGRIFLEFFENGPKISLIYPPSPWDYSSGTKSPSASPLGQILSLSKYTRWIGPLGTGVGFILKLLAQDFKGRCKTGTSPPSPFNTVLLSWTKTLQSKK